MLPDLPVDMVHINHPPNGKPFDYDFAEMSSSDDRNYNTWNFADLEMPAPWDMVSPMSMRLKGMISFISEMVMST